MPKSADFVVIDHVPVQEVLQMMDHIQAVCEGKEKPDADILTGAHSILHQVAGNKLHEKEDY